jgi:hypothetical protein
VEVAFIKDFPPFGDAHVEGEDFRVFGQFMQFGYGQRVHFLQDVDRDKGFEGEALEDVGSEDGVMGY